MSSRSYISSLGLLITTGLMLMGQVNPAQAQSRIPFVIVSHKPGEPEWLARSAIRMHKALGESVMSGDELALRAGILTGIDAETLKKDIAAKIERYIRGEMENPQQEFAYLYSVLTSDSFVLISNPKLRQTRYRLMLYYQMSLLSAGKQDEAAVILERAVRENPDLEADPVEFPPDLIGRIREITAVVEKTGTGTVELDFSGPRARRDCEAYVDERRVGRPPLSVITPAGPHRVAVLCEKDSARFMQTVVVEARRDIAVRVEPVSPADLSLINSTGVWAEEKEPEGDRALLLWGWRTGYLSGASRTIAIGTYEKEVTKEETETYLVAALVETGIKRLVRLAAFRIDTAKDAPLPESKIRAAAAFLMNEEASSELDEMLPSPVLLQKQAGTDSSAWYENAPAWTAVGIGAACLLTASVLISISDDSDMSFKHASYGFFGAGAPLTAAGLILFTF